MKTVKLYKASGKADLTIKFDQNIPSHATDYNYKLQARVLMTALSEQLPTGTLDELYELFHSDR